MIRNGVAAGAAFAWARGTTGVASAADGAVAPTDAPPALARFVPGPVAIASMELLRNGDVWLLRASSKDGVTGIAVCGDRIDYLHRILLQRVVPYFIKKDARELDTLVDGVYTHQSNYKLAGIAFWCCVAWAEFAILDLLGKIAKQPVAELLGGTIRREIMVYLSSLRRDTTPQQEVDYFARRIEQTSAGAIKFKVGGRMSRNRDASPGRTENLVRLARKMLGDKMTLYADANGSYDAAHAIEVGKLLQDHNVAFFEEPCEWEDYDATRKVADALTIPVAGGEQDSSLYRWQQMVRDQVVDIVQPDMTYNGGLLRNSRVARMAAARGLAIIPHSPQRGGVEPYLLHFAAATKNLGPFIEFNVAPHKQATWHAQAFEPKEGKLTLPDGPGWGLQIDEKFLAAAKKVEA